MLGEQQCRGDPEYCYSSFSSRGCAKAVMLCIWILWDFLFCLIFKYHRAMRIRKRITKSDRIDSAKKRKWCACCISVMRYLLQIPENTWSSKERRVCRNRPAFHRTSNRFASMICLPGGLASATRSLTTCTALSKHRLQVKMPATRNFKSSTKKRYKSVHVLNKKRDA